MRRNISISTVFVALLASASAVANMPKEPMSDKFLVIMPSAYDPAIVSASQASEWSAFFQFTQKANSSGEEYEMQYGRKTLYEEQYEVKLYADKEGEIDDDWSFVSLVEFLSGFQPGVNISWGEHHFSVRDEDLVDYLTVESWRAASSDECKRKGKDKRTFYENNGIDGLPLVFDGRPAEEIMRVEPAEISGTGKWSCNLLMHKDWIGQVLRSQRPSIEARWFHSVRCFSTDLGVAQSIGGAFVATVATGYDDTVSPWDAMRSTSEILAYMSGNYSEMLVEDAGVVDPEPNSNYSVDEAVGNIRGRQGATDYGLNSWIPAGCDDKVRLYAAPRVNELTVRSRADGEQWEDAYRYEFAESYPFTQPITGVWDYPGAEGEGGRLELSRLKEVEAGDEIEIEVLMTARISQEAGGLEARIYPEQNPQQELEIDLFPLQVSMHGEKWISTVPVKIPEEFQGDMLVVELSGRGLLPDDNDCLDTNGDGRSSSANEPECLDKNHKADMSIAKIIDFEITKSPDLVTRENPAILGDGVSTYFQFNREMDAEAIPEVWVVSGMGMSYRLPLENTIWVDGEDEDGKPLASSRFEATWNIPDDFDLSGQEFLRLDLEVRGAKTASGREVKPQRKTKDDELLSLWADLERPKPAVAGWIGPNVECGALEIDFAIEDEPSYYEPGAPISPPAAKFGKMELHLEKDGVEILTAPLSDPNEHFVRPPPWASGSYRWWVEVEDSAGNLDQISFEQEGMERTSAEHFSVTSCEEESTYCRRLTCNADKRRCEVHIVTCESSPCTSCHCDNDLQGCVCVSTGICEPDPGGYDNDGSDTYPPGYDRPDESHLYADDVPRWEDVTNEYQAARVGVLRSSVYPSMFGLLDEFGEKARLVQLPLSPEDLEGVDLLIVPSGGLRNQQTEEFMEGVLAYVEGGGQLLVMAQPLGENFDVLPGEIEGYGWQQDRSCISRNIWIEEEYREHPALSAFGSSVIDIPLDGHFTVYPEGSQTLLRKVSNNRVALFRYVVGEGSVTVTSSYLDYWRALSWGRSAAGAVEFGYGRSKTSDVMFFRDLISWLKMPAEIPRVTRDGGPVSLGLVVTNDAPGGEHAALAKLLVQEPNRNVVTEVVDLPVDLSVGESAQLSLEQEYNSVHAMRYGIWHVAVELYDGAGNLIREARDNPGGRFAVPYPIRGESYVPEDIVITITTDKSVYLSYETAHFTYTVENQGDRERHLEIDVGLVHVGYEITQDIILAPGEKWIEQRDYGLADYREDGVFCMALDLDDDRRLAANAGLKIFFLAYPLVMSASTERQRIIPGESVPVSVSYHSLYDSTIQGTLFLRAEGRPLPLLEQELAVAPSGEGSLDAMFTIPADAEPGQLTLMGRYEDEEGHVLGSCSHKVIVYSPFLDLVTSLEPDREIYRRGDTILSALSFANDSDEALDIHYQLRLGDIESPTESVSLAAGGEVTIQEQIDVSWDYQFTANENLVLEYWETSGHELYKKKRVMIEVPRLSSMIGAISATPASVDVSCEIFLEGRSDLQVDAGCRLYDPAGGLVAEELHPAIMLEPFQHLPLSCHLPPGFLKQGDYTIEVFAESPLARRTERIEKIKSDIEVKPPVTNIIGPSLAWEKSFGEAAGPVMLINKGDFSYPSVFVTESLPEVGLVWSREVAIGPQQELLVEAPTGVTIPYFRNAASYYRCIGREIMTETEDDLAAEVTGGFTVSRVETARISTPRLHVDIENVDLDLCLSDTLSFDVKGHGTVYGLGAQERR